MAKLFRASLRLLSGRLMMNIYFWAFIILPRMNADIPLALHAYAVLLYGITMAQVYLNNLILVPRFLVRKKYYAYFSLAISTAIVLSFIYWQVVWHVQRLYPEVRVSAYSLATAGEWRPGYHYLNYLSQWNAYFSYLAALTLAFTMAWYMRNYARQERITEELRRKQLETELLVLKGQINPHFLFNTLNNLYGLALEDGPKAADAIMRLSSVLRYSLYETKAATVSFEAEKEAMRSYIDLELLRLHHTDHMSFHITTDDPHVRVPPLLGLPVLENVFKHGTRMIDKEAFIDFRYSISNGKLSIYSRNRYKRTALGGGEKSDSGIGLANLRQRLQMLFSGRHTIQIEDQGEHYTLRIDVNLKSQ